MMKVTVGTDPHLEAPSRLPRHVRRHYADGRTAYITVSLKLLERGPIHSARTATEGRDPRRRDQGREAGEEAGGSERGAPVILIAH
jgi:hypothetical protein